MPRSRAGCRSPVGIIVLVFGVFVVRLFQLQILQGEELEGIAQGNAVRLVRLEAPRGDILDREGRVLATTRPAFGVTVMPNDLRRPERTLPALGMLLDTDAEVLRERSASRAGGGASSRCGWRAISPTTTGPGWSLICMRSRASAPTCGLGDTTSRACSRRTCSGQSVRSGASSSRRASSGTTDRAR